ncbi:galactitol-1-phosphate 5-dehydrogenase [Flaviflexus huanghaiensis]|uniref:galactitol-1-phosphate 5-dehydrogenase n=1 Tax=Flaviflexus huanghaiensis TaxID=1111473 RepID=UPI0015F7F665|nr:galactitol-1-phosphate 5-dehydrogenase [Flaviflexus huanghaiensis]
MATMKAVVMHGVGDIRLEEIEKPTARPGEVVMKVAACGVCGSDLDRMYKKGPHRLPLVTGHEFSAYIDEIGEGVDGFAIGDLVTAPPMLPCFECEPCLQGHYSLCENYDYYGSRRDGAYAEYVAGPANLLLKVPAGLDARAAAMVDPAAIALHAIWRTKLTAGSRVAVMGGGGPIGLFSIQWARIMGATEIVSVDVSEEKSQLALEAGATSAVSSPEELDRIVGAGFDVVIETTGVPAVADQSVGIAARHADVTLIGIPNAPVEISAPNWARLMRLEISVRGSWNSFSAPFPGSEWTTTLDHMANGNLKWEFMITHEEPLEKVADTIRAMYERTIHSSKVLFLPHGPALSVN